MEKQRSRKKRRETKRRGTGENVTKREGKASLQGRGKEGKKETKRQTPSVEGPGRREKAPSLKALPPPTPPSRAAKKWEVGRGSKVTG